jgi:hypothetical protein
MVRDFSSLNGVEEISIHGFRAEHPLEPRADKLHANYFFAFRWRLADVHNFPLGFKILSVPPQHAALHGDSDLQVRADSNVEPRAKRCSAPAQIFAGSIFFEGKSTGIAAANP